MMMLKSAGSTAPKSDETVETMRRMPHNIDAEQALLGAILLNNGVYERVSDIVVPADFFDPLHGDIYSTIAAVIKSGRVACPISLRARFESADPITPQLTVPGYLGRLVAHATGVINAVDYARTTHDLATRRQLIVIGEDVVNAAYDDETTPPQHDDRGRRKRSDGAR